MSDISSDSAKIFILISLIVSVIGFLSWDKKLSLITGLGIGDISLHNLSAWTLSTITIFIIMAINIILFVILTRKKES